MKIIFSNTEMNLTQSDVFEGVNPDEWEGLKNSGIFVGKLWKRKRSIKLRRFCIPIDWERKKRFLWNTVVMKERSLAGGRTVLVWVKIERNYFCRKG